ncbi:MAG: TadE family protein [Pseudomonadota bacterium]
MNSLFRRLAVRTGRFGRECRGSASVEFVISMPIFMILFGFIGGFGELVSQREHLDSAVFDATRLISQAPASWENPDGTPSLDENGNKVPSIYPFFEAQARQVVADRMGVDLSTWDPADPDPVQISTKLTEMTITSGDAPATFYHVEMTAVVEFNAPMLNMIASLGLISSVRPHTFAMQSTQAARYISTVAVGLKPCPSVDRAAGLCV